MCFGKFFGGSRRQRARAAPEGASMHSSLANVPQMSVDNVGNAKSSRSIGSKSANAPAGSGTFNDGNQTAAPSVNTMGSEGKKSATAGGAATDIPTSVSMVPNTTGGPADGSVAEISNVRSVRRSSWWGFLGMSKKKNSSIGSL